MLVYKKLTKSVLIKVILFISALIAEMSCLIVTNASTLGNTPVDIQAVYERNSMSEDELKSLKNAANDPDVLMSQKNGMVIMDTILPSAQEQDNEENNLSTIKLGMKNPAFYSSFRYIESFYNYSKSMDEMNGQTHMILKGKSYRGQKNGQRVKTGTHVHCNRFNGPLTDRTYHGLKNPKAYSDFIKSDCWYHATKYNCVIPFQVKINGVKFGLMTTCDGLNRVYHKGVRDCSAWKSQKKSHHNWAKTAWYGQH